MDEVSGDGSAELLDDSSIEIEFAYRNGDEAVLAGFGCDAPDGAVFTCSGHDECMRPAARLG
jgi:hypothetical protein